MIIISIILFIFIFRYARQFNNYILLPSFIFGFILLTSQLVYFVFCNFDFYKYFSIGDLKFDFDYRVYVIHYIFMIATFLAMFRLKNEESTHKSRTIRERMKSFFGSTTMFPLTTKTINIYIVIYLSTLIMVVYHFYCMPIGILLSNNQYLLLSNSTELNLPVLAALINVLSGVLAIQMLVLMILLAKSKRYFFSLGLLPFFLYFLILRVAANSRWGALIMFFSLPFLYKKGSVKSYIAMFIMVALTFTFYISALTGRNGGSYTQGVEAIGRNIEIGWQGAAILLPKIAGTAFGSGWNLDLALQRYGDKIVTFDLRYKILSFSPLLGSMDGFDNLINANILHILGFAPVNFMGELFFFGPVYFVFALIFITLAMRYCNKIVIRHGIVGLVAVSPLYLFFFRMQQYAIRNSWRWIILALIMGYIVNYFRMRKRRRNSKKAVYPQLDPQLMQLNRA